MHGQRRTQGHRGTRWLLVLVTVAAGIGLYSSVAAAAATHGTVHVWVTPGKGAVDSIVLTGVIGDHGTATSIEKNGTVNKNGVYVRVKLTQGTFEVDAVPLNQRLDKLQPVIDKTTCSAWGSGSGNITLFNGTGAYAGIRGTIRMTTSFAAVLPRYKSGPKKGQCNVGENAVPVAQFSGPITGAGSISLDGMTN